MRILSIMRIFLIDLSSSVSWASSPFCYSSVLRNPSLSHHPDCFLSALPPLTFGTITVTWHASYPFGLAAYRSREAVGLGI